MAVVRVLLLSLLKRVICDLDLGLIFDWNGTIRSDFFGFFFVVVVGKTYRFRITNVGLQHSLNFRVQDHELKLVEVEGTHTMQNTYSSLDVHVGQSYSVLITADQPSRDFYIAVSTRFAPKVLTSTAILHYSDSTTSVGGPIPGGPTEVEWSINQARSIRYSSFNMLQLYHEINMLTAVLDQSLA